MEGKNKIYAHYLSVEGLQYCRLNKVNLQLGIGEGESIPQRDRI